MINLAQNDYFRRIAGTIRVEPLELMGLLDVVFNKKDSVYINFFVKSLMDRMNIQDTKLGTIRALLDLFMSEDESVLLRAAEKLNLDCDKFLLIGKRILDPQFISSQEFSDLGIAYSELTKHVFEQPEDEYETWKTGLCAGLQSKKQRYKDKMKIPQGLNNAQFFLSNWKTQFLMKKNIQTALTMVSNSDNCLNKILNIGNNDTSYDGVDVLVTILSLRHLGLQEGDKRNKFDKEQKTVLNQLALSLNVNPDLLAKFIEMFGLKDNIELILNHFFDFIPDEKQHEAAYKIFLLQGQKQSSIAVKHLNFVSKELPKVISHRNHPKIPSAIFTRLYMKERGRFNINDFLGMISIILKKNFRSFSPGNYR